MTGLTMKYFVLKPKGFSIYARGSREAMKTYADVIEEENPWLAHDLREWAMNENSNPLNKHKGHKPE